MIHVPMQSSHNCIITIADNRQYFVGAIEGHCCEYAGNSFITVPSKIGSTSKYFAISAGQIPPVEVKPLASNSTNE